MWQHQIVRPHNATPHIELARPPGTAERVVSANLMVHVALPAGETQARIYATVSDTEREMLDLVFRPLTYAQKIKFAGAPNQLEDQKGRRFLRAAQIRTESNNRPKNVHTQAKKRKRKAQPDENRYVAPRTGATDGDADGAAYILRTEGARGFYAGVQSKLLQTSLTAAVLFVVRLRLLALMVRMR